MRKRSIVKSSLPEYTGFVKKRTGLISDLCTCKITERKICTGSNLYDIYWSKKTSI